MPTDERVLVIPAAHLRAAGAFTGFRPADPAFGAALLSPAAFAFRPRSQVETDPSFLQLIPYVVLRCGERVFHYRRGAAGTETRLAALRSVGVGGHISEADAAGGDDPYRTGMRRELTEEVELGCAHVERPLGFIFDPTTPVGAVHLGVVHVFELEAPTARPREAALADAGFAPLAELTAGRGGFETWSRLVLDELGRV
ncbi:MAG: phosphoesterase [Gemmataceae bacterium]